jgi:hypothetical protein
VTYNKQLQRTVTRVGAGAGAAQVRHFIMHSRRAGQRSARPLNCSVMRPGMRSASLLWPTAMTPDSYFNSSCGSDAELRLAVVLGSSLREYSGARMDG